MAEERSEIAFFDVETTIPLKPGESFIILEFGAILVCPKKLVELESYSTLICPNDISRISSKSERCNGISRAAVSSAPPFSAIADKIFDILNGRIWAGHNILRFDCPRIREAFAEIGRSPPEPKGVIDSLALLTERFGRRAGNMKMATLATYFGLGHQTHRSLDDVRMNLEVLKYCATVLFLESSLPDILTRDSWVSPTSTTRRTRSGGRTSPMEISYAPNSDPVPENPSNQTMGEQLLNVVEPSRPNPDPMPENPSNQTMGEQLLNVVEPIRHEAEPFDMRRLSEEIMDDAIQEDDAEEKRPITESPGMSRLSTIFEGCSDSAYLTPEDVSIPLISASLVPFYRGSRRIQILHDTVLLKLHCTHLKVRFGISTRFVDQAGRPRLSFVVDAPPSVCQVLEACDNHAQSLFAESGSTSDWRPVVVRKNGYWNFPTIRLHIPTVVTEDIAKYGTEICQREAASGAEQKLLFSTFDPPELDCLFTAGTFVDAFISLNQYDFQQTAGIRLVAEKLVIHSS
ncbi:protein NEN1-like [Chenopodium quinoa]|uniref:Exonuclease domain-containing protein n=1 Tax=Chenopodium quinoa TaxID=63459 RepID=A0A803L9A9_CHEQI|nr:protein NEN1-like [Chenopodium quinoa]